MANTELNLISAPPFGCKCDSEMESKTKQSNSLKTPAGVPSVF